MQPLSTSVGPLIKPSKLGKSYWEAAGPVQKLFKDELAPAVKDYLDRCIEPPQDCLSWSIYMRGRTAESARPYLVFTSEDEKTRKTARRMVEESDVLTKFPTVKTMHARYPPELSTLMRLLGDQVLDPGPDTKSYTHIFDQRVYYKPSDNSTALELFIDRLSTGEPARRATAGGIVCVGDRFFYLTVYHILEQGEHQPARDNELRSPSDMSSLNGEQLRADYEQGEEEDEEEEEEEEGGAADDSGFEDGSPISYDAIPTTSDSENGASEARNQRSEEPGRGGRIGSSNVNEDLLITAQGPLRSGASRSSHLGFTTLSSCDAVCSRSLDYLLLEVHGEDHKKLNRFTAPQTSAHTICVHEVAPVGNETRRVIILSACHGLSGGNLFATPRFMRLPKTTATRKTFAVQLDRYVRPGDCGSWAIDEASGHLYGHIFGGGIGTKTAYIIPADEIFEDIQRSSGQPVFLPSAKDERHADSETDSSLSRLLQLILPQRNETVSENRGYHAGLRDAGNTNQHPLRNINDRTADDAPQAASTRSQDMRETTSNEASKNAADCMDPNLADLSLKATPESPDAGRGPVSPSPASSSPKESKSSARDGGASCWSYKPESSPPVFYYSP
ncbi:hypothetical protein BDV10DRAFT_183690 [Aspergillus recurvatus]